VRHQGCRRALKMPSYVAMHFSREAPGDAPRTSCTYLLTKTILAVARSKREPASGPGTATKTQPNGRSTVNSGAIVASYPPDALKIARASAWALSRVSTLPSLATLEILGSLWLVGRPSCQRLSYRDVSRRWLSWRQARSHAGSPT